MLLLLLLGPGCVFTDGVWDWAEDRETIEGATPAAVTSWRRGDGETFVVSVRYTDESERQVTVGDVSGTGAGLLREIPLLYDPKYQAELFLLAVGRGLVTREFATDHRFTRCRDFADFQAASVAPVVTPTFTVGPLVERAAELHLRGLDGRSVPVALLEPTDHSEPRDGRKALAVVATPFTFVLDVATLPIQALYYGIVILAFANGMKPR